MLLIPLIFSSIVVGVSNLQSGEQLGRVWKTTLICCVTTTTLALILGIGCAHLFEVGKGMNINLFQSHAVTSDPRYNDAVCFLPILFKILLLTRLKLLAMVMCWL